MFNNGFNPGPAAAGAFRSTFGNENVGGLYPSTRNYGQFSTGGSLHDTFRIDRYNNIYGGHTTLDLGGGKKIHLDW
jgi:hypothetical protein